MKRTVFVLALLIVLLFTLAAPVFAVTNFGGNGLVLIIIEPIIEEKISGNLLLNRGAKLSKAIQDAKLRNKLSYEIPLWVKVEEVNNHGSLSPFFNEVR